MAEIPGCNDTNWDLTRKILIEFLSMAPSAPASLQPGCNDRINDFYRKILLTLPYI